MKKSKNRERQKVTTTFKAIYGNGRSVIEVQSEGIKNEFPVVMYSESEFQKIYEAQKQLKEAMDNK